MYVRAGRFSFFKSAVYRGSLCKLLSRGPPLYRSDYCRVEHTLGQSHSNALSCFVPARAKKLCISDAHPRLVDVTFKLSLELSLLRRSRAPIA